MDLELYTIYDRVTGLFSSPFVAVSADSAKRYFSAVMKGKIEERDVELYYLGIFHSFSGAIEQVEKPKYVMRAEVSDEK